jgi:uncharacterized protein (DUF1684 family)
VDAREVESLLDWKRRIFELYAEVRASEPHRGWERWRAVRDALFGAHPQSPLAEPDRAAFRGLVLYGYAPELRCLGTLVDVEHRRLEIATSGERRYAFTRFARVEFELAGAPFSLDAYWLDGYGGGLFLPFADATSGTETYGAGRYLLDTVKGADLGLEDGRVVLDFNFAYNPSCSYDPRWVCPLAPPANRLPVAVRAGERHGQRG